VFLACQDDLASSVYVWLKHDGSLAFPCCPQVLESNAAAPEDQRLSEAELVVDLPRLQQLRGQVDAEVAALLASSSNETQAQEIRAARIKAMCWDAMQVRVRARQKGREDTGYTCVNVFSAVNLALNAGARGCLCTCGKYASQ
jgi:hypothetical protein